MTARRRGTGGDRGGGGLAGSTPPIPGGTGPAAAGGGAGGASLQPVAWRVPRGGEGHAWQERSPRRWEGRGDPSPRARCPLRVPLCPPALAAGFACGPAVPPGWGAGGTALLRGAVCGSRFSSAVTSRGSRVQGEPPLPAPRRVSPSRGAGAGRCGVGAHGWFSRCAPGALGTSPAAGRSPAGRGDAGEPPGRGTPPPGCGCREGHVGTAVAGAIPGSTNEPAGSSVEGAEGASGPVLRRGAAGRGAMPAGSPGAERGGGVIPSVWGEERVLFAWVKGVVFKWRFSVIA